MMNFELIWSNLRKPLKLAYLFELSSSSHLHSKMTAAKLAYQTRFSVPSQLDSPAASFGHFNPYQSQHDQRQLLQEESTKLNAPVAKVLSNFDVKADQLRTFYDSTSQQVNHRMIIWSGNKSKNPF